MRRSAVSAAAVLLLWAGCGEPATEPAAPAAEVRAQSDAAELVVRLDRERAPITEAVLVQVQLIVDEGRQVEFPERIGSPEDFAQGASDVADPRLLDDGRVAYERGYELEAFLPGEFDLGRIAVEHWPAGSEGAREEIAAEGLTVAVDSVLAAGDEAEFRDIRGPVDPPLPWGLIAASLLGALLLAAAAVWAWRKRKPSEGSPEAAPLPPPHTAALEALDRLLAEDLIERGEYKLFYGLLSNIVRRYVEDRFGIHAPERTTEEFLHELKGGQALGPAHQSLLKMFLEHSDLVKFAEMTPARADVNRSVDLCRRFIHETAPRGIEQADEPAA